jgi:DNA-binding response OmpR family regulator
MSCDGSFRERANGGKVLMRILVVEDDPRVGPSLKKGLEGNKYAVDLVENGREALFVGLAVTYDLLILDVRLPELSGFEVCRQLRDRGRKMPILLLTALGEVEHRVKGLDLGADDYMVKPFAFGELEARVRALLRRESPSRTTELRFMDIVLNTHTREVRRGDRSILLHNKEYELLEFLLRHPRHVLSRLQIAEHVWDCDAERLSNVIDVHVFSLRRKLCMQNEPNVIQTVRGSGYQLREPQHD